MVLGHEGSGKILEIGEGVKNVRVGQRVSFEPGYPVEDDDFTKQGKRGMKKILSHINAHADEWSVSSQKAIKSIMWESLSCFHRDHHQRKRHIASPVLKVINTLKVCSFLKNTFSSLQSTIYQKSFSAPPLQTTAVYASILFIRLTTAIQCRRACHTSWGLLSNLSRWESMLHAEQILI